MPSSARILLSEIVLDIFVQKEVKGDKVTFLAQMRLDINSIEARKEFHRQGIKGAKKTKSSSDQNKVDLHQLKNEHLYFFCFQS